MWLDTVGDRGGDSADGHGEGVFVESACDGEQFECGGVGCESVYLYVLDGGRDSGEVFRCFSGEVSELYFGESVLFDAVVVEDKFMLGFDEVFADTC